MDEYGWIVDVDSGYAMLSEGVGAPLEYLMMVIGDGFFLQPF